MKLFPKWPLHRMGSVPSLCPSVWTPPSHGPAWSSYGHKQLKCTALHLTDRPSLHLSGLAWTHMPPSCEHSRSKLILGQQYRIANSYSSSIKKFFELKCKNCHEVQLLQRIEEFLNSLVGLFLCKSLLLNFDVS